MNRRKEKHWQWLIVIGATLFCTNSGMSQFPNNHDIYIVDVKTGAVTQASNVPNAGEFNVTWSNDGKYLAHDVVGGPAPMGHAIYTTEVKTMVSTLLAGAEGGNDASWSPNGQWIAFDRRPSGDPSIYIVPAGGGPRKLVTRNAAWARWSPNSKRLVFSDGAIHTIAIETGNTTFVAYGQSAVWSPDGQWIAFNAGGDIWKIKVNMDGVASGEPINITQTPFVNEGSMTWSNDSKTIAFDHDYNGSYDIWTIPANGGVESWLAGVPGSGEQNGDFNPCYSNNGQYVAYAGYTAPTLGKHRVGDRAMMNSPSNYYLDQNYPNPFNPTTEIRYHLPAGQAGISEVSRVTLKVFDILGREVAMLVDEVQEAGFKSVQFDASALSSGLYFYQLKAGTFTSLKKMLVVK